MINNYTQEEPLSAIIPGAALQELWGLVGTRGDGVGIVSAMVVATALLGMVTMILTTERAPREMAILRSVGARPATVMGLLATGSRIPHVSRCRRSASFLLYAGLFIGQPPTSTASTDWNWRSIRRQRANG